MEYSRENSAAMPFDPINPTWDFMDKHSFQSFATCCSSPPGLPDVYVQPHKSGLDGISIHQVGRAAFSVMHANIMAQQANQAAGVAMSMISQALLMNSTSYPACAHAPITPAALHMPLISPAEIKSPSVPDSSETSTPQTSTPNKALDTPHVTTLMVRNIPMSVTQDILLKELDKCGFEGKYDFAYLPASFHDGLPKGYAFVNFLSVEYASRFVTAWHLSHRPDFKGQTPLNISPASIQGYEANVKKWTTSRQYRIRNPNFRPFVLPKDPSADVDENLSPRKEDEKAKKVQSPPSPVDVPSMDKDATSLAGCARAVFQHRCQVPTSSWPQKDREEIGFSKSAMEQGDFVMKRVLRRQSSGHYRREEDVTETAESTYIPEVATQATRTPLSLADALCLQPSVSAIGCATMAPGDWSRTLGCLEEHENKSRDEDSASHVGELEEDDEGSDPGCATPMVANVPTPTFLKN